MDISENSATGLLVGPEFPLLELGHDPVTPEQVRAGEIRGCADIHCTYCKRDVLGFSGQMWKRRPTPQEHETAYDTGDFSSFLERNKFSHKYRAYACRCDIHQVTGWTTLLDAYRDHELNWVCLSTQG